MLLTLLVVRLFSPVDSIQSSLLPGERYKPFQNSKFYEEENAKKMDLMRAEERAEFVRKVKSTVAIGMLTTTRFHHRILESLDSWWNLQEFGDLVTIFTDSNEPIRSGNVTLVNVSKTDCDSSYHTGLWCKNRFMFDYWRDNARYDEVKWYIRLMDDSYVHMENLMDLIEQYDHTEKIVLADKFCTHYSIPYPSGGAGILFSRGFLDDFNLTDWNDPFKVSQREGRPIYDDVAWGDYMHLRKIPVLNHMGIHQAPLGMHSPHWRYWMNFERGLGRNWTLPYRPVLLHQHGSPFPMRVVHQKLHNLTYTPLADNLIDIPECKCPIGKHQKCIWDQRLTDMKKCRWGFETLECIAPGPWNIP